MHLVIICISALLLACVVGGVDFGTCLEEIHSGKHGMIGGTDDHGNPISNISAATSITYGLCLRACGAGQEPFLWSVFSKQFSSWLLPWLALVSQLPFGANDKYDNFVSVLLTVGSPALAAYSLALTVLNGRWVAQRFASHQYPNKRDAVHVLTRLQQSPLRVSTTDSLLASLIVLPKNDDWWKTLAASLKYQRTWSVYALTSISWVVVAYIFTLIDAFTSDLTVLINSTGQGVGTMWLWLLPIVIGWIQISPKCDSMELNAAIANANQVAYVATESGDPVLASSVPRDNAVQYAISVPLFPDDPVRYDEKRTAPIYNYSRFLPWVQAVQKVSDGFRAASDRARRQMSVDPLVKWTGECPQPENRSGTRSEVTEYCLPYNGSTVNTRRCHQGWSRFFVASAFAMSLQWGTTGAAILVSWFSPTVGLGCRSGSYLLYGTLSTLSWMMLVVSSFLSFYYTDLPPENIYALTMGRAAIIFRRLGKVTASISAVWILVSCLFQFTQFFDRCYCNSSVLGLGDKAFSTLDFTYYDVAGMKVAWVCGAFLAAGTATACVAFVHLFNRPQLSD